LRAVSLALVTPRTQPNVFRVEDVFLEKCLFKQVSGVVLVFQYFYHGAACRADSAFEAVFEFFGVKQSFLWCGISDCRLMLQSGRPLKILAVAGDIRVYKRKGPNAMISYTFKTAFVITEICRCERLKLMDKIRVILFGIGAVGVMIARSLFNKQGLEIVGAIDVAKDKAEKDLGEVLGLGRILGVRVSDDADAVLSKAHADIAVHATSSRLKDVYPQIATVVKHGVSVVSTCEELSYPFVSEAELAEKLDSLAKKHDATVLGTGVNPGFLMDTLVITLTAACQAVDKIEATRVMNAATRRLPFQKKIGAGLPVDEFRRKMREKQITGHVGLEQSIGMVAAAVGWKLDTIVVEEVEPVIAERIVESQDIRVEAGAVAGLRQRAKGILGDREVVALDFQAYIGAEEEYDSIVIKGVPSINERIQPCVHGDLGTVAMIVNAIPRVVNAPSGLVTMKDLPVPSAALGQLRNHVT
jgi:hypothetical protein